MKNVGDGFKEVLLNTILFKKNAVKQKKMRKHVVVY